eukprot:gb/GECG01011723.1/.p1 GENE.gb/GECG01011723.1/~~gb/GECG01011723.1/.p1  ORF type:complete len:231 (+),score=17.41 gb/GECG01011723.1/:1-693(+)
MEQAPESKDDAEVKLSGDYFFSPLPRNVKKMGFILYCAGKRGSGKTTCACNWANNYKILCPKNDVFLISSKEYDPTIKKELGYDRIHRIPTEKFSDESDHIPEISDFENCLVIFDDFFNDTNYKRILHLMNVLAERGRQENISLICIFHNITNSHSTRLILTESDYYLIWPRLMSNHAFRYFSQNYANIDSKPAVKKVKGESGSSCLISAHPKYVVNPQSVWLPDHLFDD